MSLKTFATVVLATGTLMLASCGGSQPKAPPAADTAATEAAAAQAAAADAAAVTATREAELALQESALKAKEAELAAREAELAQARADAAKPAPTRTASKPEAAKPAAVAKPVPKVVTVPAGTALNFALSSDVSTKSAKVGDAFRARLASDVVIDGQVAVPAGTIVAGQVTQVVSGSQKIGTTPTLSLHFDSLEYGGGLTIPISGDFTSTGKSEKGQDTAKIAGGAAAGAIIGHQVNSSSGGTIIGGLLGAGAGTLAAKKTGSEVKLPARTEVSVVLAAPIRIQLN
jgi:hypothetical protein